MAAVERLVRSPWYLKIVLAIWIFAPELRRYVDWQTTFHSLSILSIVPLASLLPGLVIVRKDWSTLGVGFQRVAIPWLIAFGYAFLIALITASKQSALFSLMSFCLPIVFGFILSAPAESYAAKYNRLADTLVVLAGISAAYGIYQYVAPPPWDTYWAQQADIESSQGATLPFSFRIFGTLNSTGTLAEVLTLSALLSLSRLSWRRWYTVLALVLITLALALTEVRIAWIGLIVGLVCYLVLTSGRIKAVFSVGMVAAIVFATGALISANVKDASSSLTALADRIATFGSLSEDLSAESREEQGTSGIAEAFSNPLGVGLGAIGVAAKLSTGETYVLDNGYVSRLVELGFGGFCLYCVSLIAALVFAFKSYLWARRRADAAIVDMLAVAIGIQAVLLVFESATDSHLTFNGMLFWAMVCFASRYYADAKADSYEAMIRYEPGKVSAVLRGT